MSVKTQQRATLQTVSVESPVAEHKQVRIHADDGKPVADINIINGF